MVPTSSRLYKKFSQKTTPQLQKKVKGLNVATAVTGASAVPTAAGTAYGMGKRGDGSLGSTAKTAGTAVGTSAATLGLAAILNKRKKVAAQVLADRQNSLK